MRKHCSIKCVLAVIIILLNISENCCQESRDFFDNVTNTTSCIETTAVYVQQCPTWFVPKIQNGTITCECGPVRTYDVECSTKRNKTKLGVGRCMTFNNSTNITNLGWCPYNTKLWDIPVLSRHHYTTVKQNINDLNDAMCGGLNRTGLLCSQCQDGLGPAVLSYKRECLVCLDSRYGWLLYISLTMLPTTLLCIVIVIFRLDATSVSMNIFISFCQLFISGVNFYSSPSLQHITNLSFTEPKNFKYFAIGIFTFYGLWNLDFFRYLVPPFCISNKMSTMQVIALDYTVALYPLILTALVYYFIEFHDKGYRVFVWMWRPFRRFFIGFRKTWNLKGSVVNAFATFLLLSFSKLITVSRDLLYYTDPFSICDQELQRGYLAYYDTSMKYFGSRHLAFAIPAILVSIVFILFPTLLLCFYQNRYFQKCLSCLRMQLTLLHELTKITQSCYKDGTAGTHDYRWFAGVHRSFRIFILLIIGVPSFSLCLIVTLIVLSTLIIIYRPFKNEAHNILNLVSINIIITAIVWVTYSRVVKSIPLWPVNITIGLPFVCFIIYIVHKTLLQIRIYKAVLRALHKLVLFLMTCQCESFGQEERNEVVPYRLLHPAEYPPLLSNAQRL